MLLLWEMCTTVLPEVWICGDWRTNLAGVFVCKHDGTRSRTKSKTKLRLQ